MSFFEKLFEVRLDVVASGELFFDVALVVE